MNLEKNITQDLHEISRGSESEEILISEQSFTGVDTSYFQNQNISLISNYDQLGQSHKEVNKAMGELSKKIRLKII